MIGFCVEFFAGILRLAGPFGPRRFVSCSAADCQYFHVLAFAACASPCPRPAPARRARLARRAGPTAVLRHPASAAAMPMH